MGSQAAPGDRHTSLSQTGLRIEGLAIVPRPSSGGKAMIDVRLRNTGRPIHLDCAVSLLRSDWRVSEITQPGNDGFTLSTELRGRR